MQANDLLVIYPAPHPSPKVQHNGFALHDPYLELCWMSVIGPSAAAFLRRMPLLWQSQAPARVPAGELASSLGIDSRPGIERTIRRLVQFGLAKQPAALEVAVFTTVAPLPPRFLRDASPWVRQAHDQLLAGHQPAPDSADPAQPAPGAIPLHARLDLHQHTTTAARPPLAR